VRASEMLSDLRAVGVTVTSLLVIPDHHHRGLISEDESFAAWLRDCVADGHEAVLHGYYHLRPPQVRERAWQRFVTGCYTAGEGEFYDLSEAEAAKRLADGARALQSCGVQATGFIAPAWLLGTEAESAVRAAGFAYTTRISTISDFRSLKTTRARSLVWSVRAGWRRSMSLVWNAALARALRDKPLLRVGLHPPDWDHASIRSQILRILAATLARREPITYEKWLCIPSK